MSHPATATMPRHHATTVAGWLARAYCEWWQTWQAGSKYLISLSLSHPATRGMLAHPANGMLAPQPPPCQPCHPCHVYPRARASADVGTPGVA